MSVTKLLPEATGRTEPEGVQSSGFCLNTGDLLEYQAASKWLGIQSGKNLFDIFEYIIKASR